MIELIVWLFEQLFGSQEPPARVGPRRGSGGAGRGYGQGPSSGERPKTLAELLEEARAELDAERPRPAPPPPPPPVEEPPPPPRPAPAARRDVPAARPSPIPAPPEPKPQVRVIQQPPRHSNVVQMTAPAGKPTRPKKKAAQARPAAFDKVASLDPVRSAPQRGLDSWVLALRSGKPRVRHQAAMIAILGGVILGPPKCRKRR